LAISRKIIEQAGGQIYFESVEDEGTTFFIELPIAERKEEE
jgi:two-component system nitrogen regulation sensor histidine kinase NtrY